MPPRYRLARTLTAGATARLTTVAAIAIAALALLSLWPQLATAELWQYDEWYTAERVQGILARNDWLTLYGNGLPVFKKPPLQYWLSASLQIAGLSETLALRLPSLGAALGTLCLTAHLARTLSHDAAGSAAASAPAALVLLLSSTLFWTHATSAMLDTLAAFLLTATVAATLKAWRDPRYWWLVALAVGAGALQKAPVGALALPLAAVALATATRPAPPRRHAAAAALALALIGLWPLTQWLLHGDEALRIAYRETARRFAAPTLAAAAADWSRHLRWTTWIAADGALLWAGLITASLALPAVHKATTRKATTRKAAVLNTSARSASPRSLGDTRTAALLVACFFAALTAAKGEVFDRYLLQILPLAAAATGAALASVPRASGLIAVAILSLSAGGPWKSATDAGLTRQGIAPYRPILASFRAALGPSDQPVVCGWEKSDQIIFPGALWLLGSGDRPFRRVWSPDDLSSALATGTLVPPLRGLCLANEYRTLQARLPTRTVAESAGWVHWTLP